MPCIIAAIRPMNMSIQSIHLAKRNYKDERVIQTIAYAKAM